MGIIRFSNSFKDMSKPKYKNGDWVVVKPDVYPYGDKMGQIIKVTPPHFNSKPVPVYTVKFDNGGIDDFTGSELKTLTTEQSRRYSGERIEEGAKEAPEKTHIVKDINWSDFKTNADKEWEAFVK